MAFDDHPPAPPGYEILNVLGRGGTGVVYLAEKDGHDEPIALKMLPLEVDPTRRKRFEVEADVGCLLDHPNIIRVFECGIEGDQGWISMERLEGFELAHATRDPSFALEDRLKIIVKIATALHHAHKHEIIHRDVKPSNIFLTEEGKVKLLDFGIARLKANKITKTGYIVGTPQYMSPEQISATAIDLRSDVFSLGVVMYELIASRLPWSGDNHAQIMMAVCTKPPRSFRRTLNREQISMTDDQVEALHAIIHRAIQSEPRHRFETMKAFKNAVQAFLAGNPLPESVGADPEADPETMAKRRLGWAMARAARAQTEPTEEDTLSPVPEESVPARPLSDSDDEGSGSGLWIGLLGAFLAALGVVVWLAMQAE